MTNRPSGIPNRAVLYYDAARGDGLVLFYEGEAIAEEIVWNGDEQDCKCLGLIAPSTGLWVWEGTMEWTSPENRQEDEYTIAKGTYRPLTDAEWLAFSKSKDPLQ